MGWGVSPTPRPPLPPGKTRYPLYGRLGGPQGRSGWAENLVPTGIRSWTVQSVVSRYTDWATWPNSLFCPSCYFVSCSTTCTQHAIPKDTQLCLHMRAVQCSFCYRSLTILVSRTIQMSSQVQVSCELNCEALLVCDSGACWQTWQPDRSRFWAVCYMLHGVLRLCFCVVCLLHDCHLVVV